MALKEYSRNPRAHFLNGFVQIGLGDENEARSSLRQAINTDDNPVRANTTCRVAARLEISIGNLSAAEDLLQEAISFASTDPEAHFQYAILLEVRGDRKGAENELFQAIIIDPQYEDRASRVVELQKLVSEREYLMCKLSENSEVTLAGAFYVIEKQLKMNYFDAANELLKKIHSLDFYGYFSKLINFTAYTNSPELKQLIIEALKSFGNPSSRENFRKLANHYTLNRLEVESLIRMEIPIELLMENISFFKEGDIEKKYANLIRDHYHQPEIQKYINHILKNKVASMIDNSNGCKTFFGTYEARNHRVLLGILSGLMNSGYGQIAEWFVNEVFRQSTKPQDLYYNQIWDELHINMGFKGLLMSFPATQTLAIYFIKLCVDEWNKNHPENQYSYNY